MRKLAVVLPRFGSLLLLVASLSAQQPLKTGALESHEGFTVSALPWTDASQYKEKFPKKSPFAVGVVAIQVSFRNDTDESMKINLDRIRLTILLAEDNRQQLDPLTPDEVADAVTKPGSKNVTTPRARLPIPIPKSQTSRDKNWLAVQKSAQDAAIPGSVVAPHATLQGLLYFDLQGQLDLLNTGHLYVPEIVALEKNHQLLFFDIDLSRSGR